MKLQTQVPVNAWANQLSYSHPLVLMGSCFTEHIGNCLSQAGFRTAINPHGISFNPMSIARGLADLIAKRELKPEDLVERDGLWHHWDFHSSLSGLNRLAVADEMTQASRVGHQTLQAASHLLITFGTAWVYERSDEPGQIVNNCHKFPASHFNRKRLSVHEISSTYARLIEELKAFNPGLQIVFTLSPVRHWKDGAVENSGSKAVLRLAIDELCAAHAFCSYFPAFEIMMDELRDYRFYADDLLHPNTLAQAIIWERFNQVALADENQSIAREVQAYNRMLAHRSLHPGSSADLSFRESIEVRKRELLTRYPEVTLA